MPSMLERVGAGLFRAALLLLPAPLRRRWGPDMERHFQERQAGLRSRWTAAALPLLWLREVAGLLRAGFRARRPGAWARRTAALIDDAAAGGRPAGTDAPPPLSSSTHARTGPAIHMEHVIQDLRFALRTFVRRPGVTAVAVLSLVLGIGASTAMFSVVDSVLLEPLPFEDPEELVHVYPADPDMADHPTLSGAALRGTFSEAEFFWVAERQRVFEDLGAFYAWNGMTMAGEDRPEQLDVVQATVGVLSTLRVDAVRGRVFTEEDDPREGARSVMLTRRFWSERFGEDPDVVGSTLRLDDEPHTVIGVLPPSVDAVTRRDADAWVVLAGSSTDAGWGGHSLTRVVARLRDGVTAEQARAGVAALFDGVPGDVRHGHDASVFPAARDLTRHVRAPLLVLIAGACVLLAVGCGNAAALLVGVGIDREREIAVRGALGAGRGRLARSLLTESLLLAGVGAAGGVLLAAGIHEILLLLAPPDVPRIAGATLDLRALAFAVSVATVGGVLFGMVPALGLSRPDLASSMVSARGTTRARGRLQGAVVVGELALATVLLVSAALLGRTVLALDRVELGLDTEGLHAVRLALPFQRFGGEEAGQGALDAYLQEVVDAVRSTPGVEEVALTNNVPLTGDRTNNNVTPEGWDADAQGEVLVAERRAVSAGYFAVTRIELVEGRAFEAADDREDAAPVIVISEGLARRVWPDEPAVGRGVSFWGRDPATVVGVAADIRDEALDRTTNYAFYVPRRQVQDRGGSLLVRVGGDPATTLPAIREAIWRVDPELPITSMTSLERIQSDATSDQRYRARLMVAFAVLAAVLALMGVYGVVARSVARRTREMGIRAALGAKGTDIHGLVLVQGLRLALFGGLLGVAASAWASRYLEGMLFGVDALDVPTLMAIAVGVGVASMAASLPPSRRATRVDPTEALQAE